MYKVVITLSHKPEEYRVKLSLYNGEGKLVREEEYNGVKRVVLRVPEIAIARQLSSEPLVLCADAKSPRIEFRESSVLYVVDEG
ncbi:MAG: hypothetical protein DRO13_01350 [Thermoprotei archaeon]|nr:MAG: hypothetical protein DRO13_01350 [Thermoprotei archaeon]